MMAAAPGQAVMAHRSSIATMLPIDTSNSHKVYVLLSVFLLVYALLSNFIRDRLHLAEPPLAMVWGMTVGPGGLGLIAPDAWFDAGALREESTRFVLGIQCFVIGIELPRHYLRSTLKSLVVLLAPVMLLSWAICTALALALFPTLHLPVAAAIAACLCPTDPILAASILGGSHFSSRIPTRLRNLLKAESGGNDGTAIPLLWLAIYWMRDGEAGRVVKDWVLDTLLYECVGGVFVGAGLGWVANRVLKGASTRELVGETSYLAFYLLLSTLCIGVGAMLGVDDFLLCFAAGAGFSSQGDFHEPMREAALPRIVDLLFNAAFFIYFGATIPWYDLVHTPQIPVPALAAFIVGVLLLRRLPPIMLLWKTIPEIKTSREALFCGWFGPMGVGAVFLAQLLRSELGKFGDGKETHEIRLTRQVVLPIIYAVVLASTLVHGLSTGIISVYSHLVRPADERAEIPGAEQDLLAGFRDDESGGGQSDEGDEDIGSRA
ncbi:hypothetical protein PYCC9005_003115 [Savitreella phatthalungensis]